MMIIWFWRARLCPCDFWLFNFEVLHFNFFLSLALVVYFQWFFIMILYFVNSLRVQKMMRKKRVNEKCGSMSSKLKRSLPFELMENGLLYDFMMLDDGNECSILIIIFDSVFSLARALFLLLYIFYDLSTNKQMKCVVRKKTAKKLSAGKMLKQRLALAKHTRYWLFPDWMIYAAADSISFYLISSVVDWDITRWRWLAVCVLLVHRQNGDSANINLFDLFVILFNRTDGWLMWLIFRMCISF